jgi:hypothetical protein
MSSRTQKLISLRARTDHDLLVLISHELDRALMLVGAAEIRSSPAFARAEKAYQTTTAVLPRISGVGEDDRLRIEARLKELRSKLDEVPSFLNGRRFPASFKSWLLRFGARSADAANEAQHTPVTQE